MEKRKYPLGYWNTNGIAVAIVAVANYVDDQLFDWAAYVGGTTKTEHEEDAHDEAARYGAKLDANLAHYLARRKAYPLTRETYRQ